MSIQFFVKDFRLNTNEQSYIEKRVAKIAHFGSKLNDEATVIRVEIEKRETKAMEDHFDAKIHVNVPAPHNTPIFAEDHAETPTKAIDLVLEKLTKQIEKYKTKMSGK